MFVTTQTRSRQMYSLDSEQNPGMSPSEILQPSLSYAQEVTMHVPLGRNSIRNANHYGVSSGKDTEREGEVGLSRDEEQSMNMEVVITIAGTAAVFSVSEHPDCTIRR